MALSSGPTGSQYPTFDLPWLVGLKVKPAYAIALYVRLPSVLSGPLKASDTLSEATTPVKLPTKQCPPRGVRLLVSKGWYFNIGSTTASAAASKPPTYPTHHLPEINVKL